MAAQPEAVLVNLGTPAEPTAEAVRAFLRQFLSDPLVVDKPPRWIWMAILHGIVLRKRPPVVAELYRQIWGDEGSPLAAGTSAIARALGQELGTRARVSIAYRYGEPSLASVIEEAAGRAERIVVLPLFPQPTASTTGTIEREVERCARRLGLGERLTLRRLAADDPAYVTALAGRLAGAMRNAEEEPEHLLISFHGIPTRVDAREGNAYSAACRATADALVRALDWPRDAATLTYQSRFGREPWLGPSTEELLRELPGRGVCSLAVVTPGFLTEGLETIEEIGERGRETFSSAGGGSYLRVPVPGDHPRLVEALAQLALKSPA